MIATISVLKKSLSIVATICVGTTPINLDTKHEPYVDSATVSTSFTYPSVYPVYNIEKKINSFPLQEALSLFGVQRKYTDDERKIYLKATYQNAKKIGFSVLDYMRNKNQ